ncbi:unnamed protein product [Allacma fusca]|uniref:Uncharacterized protein n=1 Tax=Allacma fusca TaxID=39272 RepID=A0A8J2KLN8_9HEXA|nr:unnamed protein product [Allacma fusca]
MGRYKIYASLPKPLKYIPRITKQRLLQNYSELRFPELPTRADDTENDSDICSSVDSEDENFTTASEAEKLYPQARISESESAMLILAFVHRHNLSQKAMEDLVELIEFHTPVTIQLPKTKYKIKKVLTSRKTSTERHCYCNNCLCYLGISPAATVCDQCNPTEITSASKVKENYFLMFNFKEAIVDVLQRNTKWIKFSSRPQTDSTFTDITDGESYKRIVKATSDFTCSLNTDKMSPFKSSLHQIWPFLISINEIPYKIRRQNFILVALWFGESKPKMSSFLNPVVTIFNKLSKSGLQWNFHGETMTSKILFPILVCDSPARSLVLGMKQHNGMYSCQFCLHPGETFWASENSHKTIMPHLRHGAEIRTKETFLSTLRELRNMLNSRNAKSHLGIQEASQLLLPLALRPVMAGTGGEASSVLAIATRLGPGYTRVHVTTAPSFAPAGNLQTKGSRY